MFTDMKGYTARTANASQTDLINLLVEHDRRILPLMEMHGGHLVKTIGDALMLRFRSPTNAVRAAIEVQKTLKKHNTKLPTERRIQIRIGIHVGPVTEVDGDLFGNTVNVAARIESLAKPGSVTFSDEVKKALPANMRVVSLGKHKLKGVPGTCRIYSSRNEGLSGRASAAHAFAVQILWRRLLRPGFLITSCGIALAFAALGAQARLPVLAAVCAAIAFALSPIALPWGRTLRPALIAVAVGALLTGWQGFAPKIHKAVLAHAYNLDASSSPLHLNATAFLLRHVQHNKRTGSQLAKSKRRHSKERLNTTLPVFAPQKRIHTKTKNNRAKR